MEEQTLKILNKVYTLTVVLVLGILVFFVGQIILQSKAIDVQDQNQITVSGEGKVYAKPDVALVSLGVTTQATTVADATKNNTDKMNAVIEAVKNLGVEEKDIQTTNYNLFPVYADTITPLPASVSGVYNMPVKTSPTITGYSLEQDIQVKIRDFTKIGDIISEATAKGSNLVGSLQFSIDNPEQYKEQARAQAIEQAKASAQNIAKESGVRLGKIINVYENYYPVMYSNTLKGTGMAAPEAVATPDIQPGQQEINITVNLTYQVR